MAPSRSGLAIKRQLHVGGFTAFTTIDYPGNLSAVVFVQGCPWRCGYCHNPHLQSREGAADKGSGGPPWGEILSLLRRRVGLLDAVVFSGGEPTMDPSLADAMRDVRSLGMQIGLHTAGMYPRRLVEVLPLVDWVGIDVKAPLGDAALHERLTGIKGGDAPLRESVRAVLASGVAHEFRTTAHPALLGDEALLRIGAGLAAAGASCFALQIYRAPGLGAAALEAVGAGYPQPTTLARLQNLFSRFTLRRDP